jgi:hypothetical protein
MIDSFYLCGSDGRVNLFFRAKGTVVETDMKQSVEIIAGEDVGEFEYYEWKAEKSSYVVQWEGSPHYDSGYFFFGFDTFGEAYQEFERQRKET